MKMSRQNGSTVVHKLITPEIQDSTVTFTGILYYDLIGYCSSCQKQFSWEQSWNCRVKLNDISYIFAINTLFLIDN